MKNLHLLIGAAGIVVLGTAAAETVADPVAEMIRAGYAKDDPLVVAKFDWTEDGKDDLLISSEKNIEMGGRDGGTLTTWVPAASSKPASSGRWI